MKSIVVAFLVLAGCGSARAATPATPRACPAGSTVVVVGDSIAMLAANILDAKLVAAGYTPEINARGGRTISEGIDATWGFNYKTAPARCWVIALGTNDIIHQDVAHAQTDIDELVNYIPAGDPAWWVRVAIVGNEQINPLVTLPMIDWRPTAAQLETDLIHPNAAVGLDAWASTVMATLTQARS